MSRSLALFFVFCSFICGSCSRENSDYTLKNWLEDNGKVKVLSTTCMLSDLVSKVGGEFVDSMCLIGSELDPHSYQLVKGDDEKLSCADIIFYNGLGLEHGPSLRQYIENSDKAVGVGDEIARLYKERILTFEGQADPHIWTDISLWAKALPFIVKQLSKCDSSHAEIYRLNAEKFQKELEEAHDYVKLLITSIPESNRYLVTSHDAFNYFTKAYLATPEEIESNSWSKRFQAPEGLAPDSQLSSSHIQQILEHLIKYQIHILFPESNVSKDSIRKLIQAGSDKGVDLAISDTELYGDAMGPKGSDAETYIGMITHNARTLQRYLTKPPVRK